MEPYNDPSMNWKRNQIMAAFHSVTVGVLLRQAKVVLVLPFTSTQILTRNSLWLYRYAFVLKTSILLLRTFTRVHVISGCSLHLTLFEETMLYFLRNIKLGGMETTSAQRPTSSQLRWSFLVKTKRTIFLKLASICKQRSTRKKKTLVNLRSCCLLKIKMKYQLLKDSKSVASVKSIFFFANTFQATLHKIRNFEKFSNKRLR